MLLIYATDFWWNINTVVVRAVKHYKNFVWLVKLLGYVYKRRARWQTKNMPQLEDNQLTEVKSNWTKLSWANSLTNQDIDTACGLLKSKKQVVSLPEGYTVSYVVVKIEVERV